jgi:benzoyl-CoA reductase subunit B
MGEEETEMERQLKKANRLQSASLIGKMMTESFIDIKQQAAEGKKVVWANGLPVYILARAADLPVLHAEGLIAGLAARRQEKPLQDAAEAFGLLPDACSYARSFFGAARIAIGDYPVDPSPKNEVVVMPKPDLYVNSAGGCGTGRVWGESMSRLCDIPVIHFEPRFLLDESELDYSVADFVSQEQELIAALEEITGRPYNWDRLKEMLVEVKRTTTLRQEIMDLCTHVPAPASFFDWATSIGAVAHLIGLPGTSDLLEKMKAEVEQRIEEGIGAVPDEKYRLYWDGILTWPRLGVLADKFAALDAAVVAGIYTHVTWWPRPDLIDPERPLESIAYNCCDLIFYHDFPYRIKVISDLCQKYAIDGLVMSETQTCRAFNSQTFAVMDGVGRRLGIPAIAVGGDSCDERFYSDAQVDTRLQALLETIDARRKETG